MGIADSLCPIHRGFIAISGFESPRASQLKKPPTLRFAMQRKGLRKTCAAPSIPSAHPFQSGLDLSDRLLPPAIIVVVISPACAVIDLLHPLVVPAPEPFAVFVRSPPGQIRIAILVAIVHVWPAVVPKVAIGSSRAVIKPAPLPCLFPLVVLVTPLRLSIPLSLCALRTPQQRDRKCRYQKKCPPHIYCPSYSAAPCGPDIAALKNSLRPGPQPCAPYRHTLAPQVAHLLSISS